MALFALLSALFGISVATDQQPIDQPTNQFNFFNYLNNAEWDVTTQSINQLESINQLNDVIGHYSFVKDNSTHQSTDQSMALIGHYYENDTTIDYKINQPINHATVRVQFDTPSSGSWLIDVQGEAPVKVFDFSFPSIDQLINQPTAVGQWLAEDTPTFYFLQITQPDRFSIILTPSDFADSKQVKMLNLKKKLGLVQKTFFQNYGTWLMLAVFFVVQMYMKTKGKMGDAMAASAAPAAPRAAAVNKKTK